METAITLRSLWLNERVTQPFASIRSTAFDKVGCLQMTMSDNRPTEISGWSDKVDSTRHSMTDTSAAARQDRNPLLTAWLACASR